jgi:hypothetical protein
MSLLHQSVDPDPGVLVEVVVAFEEEVVVLEGALV